MTAILTIKALCFFVCSSFLFFFKKLNNNDRSWARLHTSWRTINLQPGVGCAKWSNIFRWHIQTKSSWPSTARKCKSLLPAHLTPFGTTRKAKLHNAAAPRDDKQRICSFYHLPQLHRLHLHKHCFISAHYTQQKWLKNTHVVRQNKKMSCYSDGGVRTAM